MFLSQPSVRHFFRFFCQLGAFLLSAGCQGLSSEGMSVWLGLQEEYLGWELEEGLAAGLDKEGITGLA